MFIILAVPLSWFLIPYIFQITHESIYSALLYCFTGSVGIWLLSATSIKTIVLITFLPSVFAFGVGVFSLLAMKWKKAFHFIVKEILIRCAEKNPVVVLIATFAFIMGLLILLAKYLHVTVFL